MMLMTGSGFQGTGPGRGWRDAGAEGPRRSAEGGWQCDLLETSAPEKGGDPRSGEDLQEVTLPSGRTERSSSRICREFCLMKGFGGPVEQDMAGFLSDGGVWKAHRAGYSPIPV